MYELQHCIIVHKIVQSPCSSPYPISSYLLSCSMDEQSMHALYQIALYAELAANDGRITTDNGWDFSTLGILDKNCTAALSALMQKALILSTVQSISANDASNISLILEETLDKIVCLVSRATGKTEEFPLVNELEKLVTEESRRNFNLLDNYYQELLSPAKPKAANDSKNNSNSSMENIRPIPGNKAPSKEFMTAGQMLGRPPPTLSKTVNDQNTIPRKPVGLSKRIKSDPPRPMPIGAEEITSAATQCEDPLLKGIDPKLVETIKNEIIHKVDSVTWDQIAGLQHAKQTIQEIVIWPMLRPDLFTGLCCPPKGLLLFGPPGTGKTMIGKCIASQSQATFFSISASSLTSKWVGEGEKLVRALFACARAMQPSVVFIDEIDSLLTQRTDGEFEASRRIKTEFLVQFDGTATASSDRILIVGATNRPQELDEAARRRLVKRLYIPLPDLEARKAIIENLLLKQRHSLASADISEIGLKTDGYSGADVDNLCREAALGPIRSIKDILQVSIDQVRPIDFSDFAKAMSQVRASVSSVDLQGYLDWNEKFGSIAIVE